MLWTFSRIRCGINRGRLFINPGSILLPRQRVEKTFSLLEMDENQMEVRFETLDGQLVEQAVFKRG